MELVFDAMIASAASRSPAFSKIAFLTASFSAARLFRRGEVDIGEEHLHAMRGHGLGDARTHLARTDNGDCIDHDCFILATATIALH
jgi:hypothetical protein